MDCSELMTPCKELLPEKGAKGDTPKVQNSWQAQTGTGHLAAAEKQMEAATTTQSPH